jgi:hypothetical protein
MANLCKVAVFEARRGFRGHADSASSAIGAWEHFLLKRDTVVFSVLFEKTKVIVPKSCNHTCIRVLEMVETQVE